MTTSCNLLDNIKKGESFRIKSNGIDFAFEKRLYMKLYTMCKRITNKHPTLDACIVNSGYEGEGKTNTSLVEAIVAQTLIGTSIHFFFKTSSCLRFAQKTERKIIILDEPSFESLSTDSLNRLNKDFLRLTSTMRKKRHFLIINFAKFWKFPEFLVVDRALGMVHMTTKNGKKPGRFVYIRKKNLEALWNAKKKSNKRLYGSLKSFGGKMPYIMEEIFKNYDIQVEDTMNATIEDYDMEKDKAIESIGSAKKSKKDLYMDKLKKKISTIWKTHDITQKELADHLGVNRRSIGEWAEMKLDEY